MLFRRFLESFVSFVHLFFHHLFSIAISIGVFDVERRVVFGHVLAVHLSFIPEHFIALFFLFVFFTLFFWVSFCTANARKQEFTYELITMGVVIKKCIIFENEVDKGNEFSMSLVSYLKSLLSVFGQHR
jgi:hypothetical protein